MFAMTNLNDAPMLTPSFCSYIMSLNVKAVFWEASRISFFRTFFEISISMIKLCASSISKPLHLIFRNCLETESFPKEWKKANIIPVHKKGDKQLITNYRPVSLLPICGKVFEKIIFNSLFVYLNNNNLLNSNQPGDRPGDSCVNQLISIAHDIYKAFDANTS